jgi:hypothetical protein
MKRTKTKTKMSKTTKSWSCIPPASARSKTPCRTRRLKQRRRHPRKTTRKQRPHLWTTDYLIPG